MPVKTYIVIVETADAKRRRLTVVSDSPQGARAKARERKIPGAHKPFTVVKVLRLHEGPPRERAS